MYAVQINVLMNIKLSQLFANDYSIFDYETKILFEINSLENYEIILFALPKAHERIIEYVGSFIDLLHHAVLALCSNYHFHNRSKGSQVEFQMLFLAPTKALMRVCIIPFLQHHQH